MTRDELNELAERVEALADTDRNVDWQIEKLLFPRAYMLEGPLPQDPRYTASLDAALTLVPQSFDWLVRSDEKGSFANVSRHDATNFATIQPAEVSLEPEVVNARGRKQGHNYATAFSPALALTAAALRARAEAQP